MMQAESMQMVPLQNVTQHVRNGLSIPQRKEVDGLPISRIETISSGVIDPERVGYAGIQEGERKDWLLRDGDILFSHINSLEHLGKVAIYDGHPAHLIHGMNLLCIRPKASTIVPKFLLYALRSDMFRNQLPRITKKSVNQVSLSISSLVQLLIPCPPLGEQQRIAMILDKADAMRGKRQDTCTLGSQLLCSRFYQLYGDPVANSRGWPTTPLSWYGVVTTGNTPTRTEPANYGNAIEWIKSDNVNTPNTYLTLAAEGLSEQGKQIGRIVPAGSTLVTCIAGSPDCVGNAALADREVAFNQQINAITPNSSTDPHFLYSLICYSKPLIQRASTESMKGMVSKRKFESVRFICVPYEKQIPFGRDFERIHLLLEEQNEAAREADQLFNSLVQRAFRGEL